MLYIILTCLTLLFAAGDVLANADTVRFRIYGECEMCQERIEGAIKKLPGVSYFSWDPEQKLAKAVFDKKIIPYIELHKAAVAVGHDTDLLSAEDSVYEALHECCHYTRPARIKNYVIEDVTIEKEQASMLASYSSPMNMTIMTKRELFKAACCNLSESFETNPSVDVTFSDAVTGAKQIEMLGLAGIYSQITKEGLPAVRGINSIYGLTQIPGTWIESIQVNKGAGSVINGYESITGQINVELLKPQSEMNTLYNAYVNDGGRFEGNAAISTAVNEEWGTTLLLFGKYIPLSNDRNDDGFLDIPRGTEFTVMNRWQYSNGRDWEGQIAAQIYHADNIGGQKDFDIESNRQTSPFYGVRLQDTRYEGWGKLGYSNPDNRSQSVGLQVAFTHHKRDAYFGRRDYMGDQTTIYANLIAQTSIFVDDHSKEEHNAEGHIDIEHTIKGGLSWLSDQYHEQYITSHYKRTEQVPGIFAEYSLKAGEIFSAVAGIRADFHNLFGTFFTPRLHIRYAPVESTVFRLSGGRGQRTANVFAENMAVFVSSRQADIIPNGTTDAYNLQPEVAWNFGGSITQYFTIAGQEATFAVEAYRTEMEQQVVIDLDNSPRTVLFYNLEGKSYSTSIQAELSFSLFEGLPIRAAYRYVDAQTQYLSGMLERPFVSRHRAFLNVEYKTENGWAFDVTPQWFGKKRLPSTTANPANYQLAAYSDPFVLVNAQITKTLTPGFDVYLGAENVGNFMQHHPIVASENPFGEHFDSTFIWGPIMGRMFYAGFRFTPQ